MCLLHDKEAECSQDGSLSERSTCICSGLATINWRTVWVSSLGEQFAVSAAGMHGRPSLGFGEPAPNECVVWGRSCPTQRWHPWPRDGTWLLLPSGENPWQLPGARKGTRGTGRWEMALMWRAGGTTLGRTWWQRDLGRWRWAEEGRQGKWGLSGVVY